VSGHTTIFALFARIFHGVREAKCVPVNPSSKTRHERAAVVKVTLCRRRRRQGPDLYMRPNKGNACFRPSSTVSRLVCGPDSGTGPSLTHITRPGRHCSNLFPCSPTVRYNNSARSHVRREVKKKARHPTPANSLTVLSYIFAAISLIQREEPEIAS
jgi:hypothetical protein